MSDDQNWRLQAKLDSRDGIDELIKRLSAHEEALGASVNGVLPPGVELSREGDTLFAYASTKLSVDGARSAIQGVLSAERRGAEMRVSRWDADVEAWRQVEPPLTDEELARDEARALAAARHETRTVKFLVGRIERSAVEAEIASYAEARGLDCTIAQKNHVLLTRLTVTISGPASKLEEFEEYARSAVKQMSWGGDGPIGP
jgi:hypothetical protein